MEYGGVRPAHPVEHHALELEQFRFLGISTKGESPVAPECGWSWSDSNQQPGYYDRPIANMKPVAIDERNAMERRLGQVGRSVDLQPERFDDRRPESNIGCERLPEFFRV